MLQIVGNRRDLLGGRLVQFDEPDLLQNWGDILKRVYELALKPFYEGAFRDADPSVQSMAVTRTSFKLMAYNIHRMIQIISAKYNLDYYSSLKKFRGAGNERFALWQSTSIVRKCLVWLASSYDPERPLLPSTPPQGSSVHHPLGQCDHAAWMSRVHGSIERGWNTYGTAYQVLHHVQAARTDLVFWLPHDAVLSCKQIFWTRQRSL